MIKRYVCFMGSMVPIADEDADGTWKTHQKFIKDSDSAIREWVPVSKRFPDIGEPVHLWHVDGVFVAEGKRLAPNANNLVWEDAQGLSYGVAEITHWMKTPRIPPGAH